MQTIIFGGLGTIAETSELHRASFNSALAALDLPWEWSQIQYQEMLNAPGGKSRISEFLASQDANLVSSADTLHALKSRFYLQSLTQQKVEPRTGLTDLFARFATREVRFAIASTTSKENIHALLEACNIPQNQFVIIGSKSDVAQSKPAPDIYDYVLHELSAIPSECIAIEDSESGVASAVAAGLTCYAIPGLNTATQNYRSAKRVLTDYTELD